MQEKFNQYYLKAELARKYSHLTYLASPINQPEHQVVLTVFASSLFHFSYEREKLLQKAQFIKKLQHQHLTPIIDMGIEQEQPFIVREYLTNQSLRSRLKKIYPHHLELGEALAIVSQVGQSLIYMHEHNIFHGNIKPENILFDTNNQVIVTDFNLIDRTDTIIRDQATEEYAFCYMAPEQFAGICDAQSDQYALGCLAYELITGQVPFVAQRLASITGQSSNTQPMPLSQSVADLPPSLETAVLKTLAKNPTERFFDFSLFLEVIQSVLFPRPAFPLVRSTYADKNRTTSRLMKSATVLPDDSSAQIAMTSLLTKQETDGLLLTNLFVEEGRHESLVITPASFAYGRGEDPTIKIVPPLMSSTDRTLSTIRYRRRFIRLTLLLLVIATLIIPVLWLARMSVPTTSLHTTQNMVHMVHTQTTTFPMPQPSAQITNTPTVQPSVQVTNTANTQLPAQTTTFPTAPPSVPTPTPVVDRPMSYEAEASANTLTGSALVISCPPCSRGERVGSIGTEPSKNVDGSLQFNHVSKSRAGTYTLTLYFTQGDPGNRTAYISVNGSSAITCQAASTGSWYTVATVSVTVSLNAGNNTIEVFNPSSNAPDIDRIIA